MKHLEQAPDFVIRDVLRLQLGLGLSLRFLELGDRDDVFVVDLFLFICLRILLRFRVYVALYIHVWSTVIYAEVEMVDIRGELAEWLGRYVAPFSICMINIHLATLLLK